MCETVFGLVVVMDIFKRSDSFIKSLGEVFSEREESLGSVILIGRFGGVGILVLCV